MHFDELAQLVIEAVVTDDDAPAVLLHRIATVGEGERMTAAIAAEIGWRPDPVEQPRILYQLFE